MSTIVADTKQGGYVTSYEHVNNSTAK